MHTRLQMRDGALVEIYTFDEAFDRHVTFAVETYLDYAPPSRSWRPGCRQHSANLDPRYTPPSQVTTERIILVIDELMTEELVQLIVQQRTEVRRVGRRRRSVVVGRRSRGVAAVVAVAIVSLPTVASMLSVFTLEDAVSVPVVMSIVAPEAAVSSPVAKLTV